ncbi:unnamed protein product [Rangifer tarandus platyrhynchus]|uniref:Uncharacterized protein n=2 Tax=Rangifer tarandus platyrhynchus TaxID=3082113 RepID=A0AC59YJB4_RANTA|nr:unnamed protein product [Rangifer tarandus platyrhynchus]
MPWCCLSLPRARESWGHQGVEGAGKQAQGSRTTWRQELEPPQLTSGQENCKGRRTEAGSESGPCPGASVGDQNQSRLLDEQDSWSPGSVTLGKSHLTQAAKRARSREGWQG